MAEKTGSAVRGKNQKWQKRVKSPYLKFKRLENRQKVIEQARRAIYAYLLEMTHENIELAKKGNSSVAKFLMNFAGIDEFAAAGGATAKKAKAAQKCACETRVADDPGKAVLSFYKKLGMEPPQLKPAPSTAEPQSESLVAE